jgi:hypothetical protein
MAHPRKLVRQAVVALLGNATDAGDRVKGTRVEPHKKSLLPAIGVYTLTDPVDEDLSTNNEEAHVIELEVVIWVAHKDSYTADDAMDDVAEQVEAAMRATVYSGSYLGGKASDIVFKGTVMEVVEDDGRSDPETGIAVLKYDVTYRASKAAPAPVDDFRTVAADQKIVGGVPDTAPVSDQFTVQEP